MGPLCTASPARFQARIVWRQSRHSTRKARRIGVYSFAPPARGISMAAFVEHGAFSRRRFLLGSSALAFGAGLGIRAAPARAPQPSEAAWRHLAEKLSGPVLRAKDFDIGHVAHPVNLRYAANLPDAVALCRTAEDVAPRSHGATRTRFRSSCSRAATPMRFLDAQGRPDVQSAADARRHGRQRQRDSRGRHAQPEALRLAGAERRRDHARPLPHGRCRRIRARRRHRLQHAHARARLRSAHRKRDRHGGRPDPHHRPCAPTESTATCFGPARRRRWEFRRQHLVHARDLRGARTGRGSHCARRASPHGLARHRRGMQTCASSRPAAR
jgi:hypothetical protein